ncbi:MULTISPECIES: SurA N-terminal domain-containing protein [Pseudomonas]|uniref:SurA N-terminal domain-containing protein n=1 Tax=Pseudomonas TaxID=286 RepID=UPI00123B459B|nr:MULTISPECIES: SurA N-terminal domain-containing protein [Pseudomonas]QIB52494.1 peptidylprolyl isomerase [Pseudomonas sp. OIL-1]
MLQKMRDNAQSWVAKVIVGVIVLIFALTGWESISRFTSDEEKAAEVNGTVITKTELEQAVSLQRQQLIQQLRQMGNDNFDPSLIDDNLLRASVLDSLIERAVLLDGAAEADLKVSEQMIDQLILGTPDFQVDGQFNADRFDIVIRNMGLASRMAFRDLVRQELLIAQLRNAYQATAFATPAERERLARLENQTRDFAVMEVTAEHEAVDISEEDVQQHYEENKEQFKSPEKVVLEAVTLSRRDFFDQVEVDEEAIEQLYQREVGNLVEQRRAAHILVEINDDEDAALERAQEAYERIEAGADFAEVAKEYSDDSGSANRGGDLGFTVEGSFDPAFDETLSSLEEGQVSEPVRTSYGYHLIKLTDLQAPDLPTLDEMRDNLEQELKTELVERRFVEASQELADLAYESPDLAGPAESLGLEIETIGPVEQSGGEGLTSNPKVMMAAFDEEVLVDGRNSPLLELDADTVVVLRVKEHMPQETLSLDDAREEIVDVLRYRRATEKAERVAEEAVSELRSGDVQAEQLAESLEAGWEEHEAVGRSSQEVLPALLRNVFAMPRPDDGRDGFAQFRKPDGGRWIVQLKGVATPEDALTEAESPMFERFIAGQTGEQDFTAIQQKLKEDAEVERF